MARQFRIASLIQTPDPITEPRRHWLNRDLRLHLPLPHSSPTSNHPTPQHLLSPFQDRASEAHSISACQPIFSIPSTSPRSPSHASSQLRTPRRPAQPSPSSILKPSQ